MGNTALRDVSVIQIRLNTTGASFEPGSSLPYVIGADEIQHFGTGEFQLLDGWIPTRTGRQPTLASRLIQFSPGA